MNRPRVVNRLPQFVDERQRRAARAMVSVVVKVGSEASVMTPIATSNLLNSQYREVSEDGGRIVGRIGYTAEYALPVHDPDRPQNFRRATAEKEFLRKGGDNSAPEIAGIIARALRA